MIVDCNGQEIELGQKIRLWQVPYYLLVDLPFEDIDAIADLNESYAEVSSLNPLMQIEENTDKIDSPNVELEFTDKKGNMHWIWVPSEYLVIDF